MGSPKVIVLLLLIGILNFLLLVYYTTELSLSRRQNSSSLELHRHLLPLPASNVGYVLLAPITQPQLAKSTIPPTSSISLTFHHQHHHHHSDCPAGESAAAGQNQSFRSQLPYWADTDVRTHRYFAEVHNEGVIANWPHKRQLGFRVGGGRYYYGLPRAVDGGGGSGLPPSTLLEVIVLPHSHNDPGHKLTFLEYYNQSTSAILSSAHRYLSRESDVRFAWAEIAFLDLWWQNHGAKEREALRRVIDSGQVEILSGGWVMPDEATTHYFGLVMQLLEGHEWLRNHLGASATPVTHWSIDSSGLSPTIPYLAGQAGFRQGVAKRVHFAVKSRMGARRQLEFRWRQAWAGASASTDILTHLMPLHGIHISSSCGPDPEVCCQFDFHHIGKECLGGWGGHVVGINESNVAERADMLAEQFQKKAQLFRGNVILVPWGEDQRYASVKEWRDQVDNLRRLFTHINAQPQRYNMHVRFGTVRQYFDLLRQQLRTANTTTTTAHRRHDDNGEKMMRRGEEGVKEDQSNEELSLPTLSGDFFPYAIFDKRFWTGYFHSQPFHKQLDRILSHYVRTADILFSVALSLQPPPTSQSTFPPGLLEVEKVGMEEAKNGDAIADETEPDSDFSVPSHEQLLNTYYPQLVVARRTLSLFQHHDAISATSNAHVMRDYALRINDALNNCTALISKVTSILLAKRAALPAVRQKHHQHETASAINNNNTATINTEEGSSSTDGDFPKIGLSDSLVNGSSNTNPQLLNLSVAEEFLALEQPQQRIIPPQSKLVLFNPLAFERTEVVCVHVAAPTSVVSGAEAMKMEKSEMNESGGREYPHHNILPILYEIHSSDGDEAAATFAVNRSEWRINGTRRRVEEKWRPPPLLPQQIEPVVEVDDGENNTLTIARDRVKLCFRTQIPALSFRSFYLDSARRSAETSQPSPTPSIAKLHFKGGMNTGGLPKFFTHSTTQIKPCEGWRDANNLILVNDHVSLHFDPCTGFLQQLARRSGASKDQKNEAAGDLLKLELSFVRYRPKPYKGIPAVVFAFHPEGPAQPLQNSTEAEEGNAYVLIEGPVRKSVVVRLGGPYRLLHTVELDAHSDAPTIRNRLDLSHLRDEEVEVGMRLQSDPRLTDFYTEVNAYQFVRRRRIAEAPLPTRFYPMPGAAFIESSRQRLSMLGRQPLGTASLEPGWMEVMLDRRLNYDGRGLDALNDSYPTESVFRLLWETYPTITAEDVGEGEKEHTANFENAEADTAYHSLNAHHASLRLQYPVVVQYSPNHQQHLQNQQPEERAEPLPIPLMKALPFDVHMVALRTLSNATNYLEPPSKKGGGRGGGGSNGLVNFTSLSTMPRRAAALILHRVGVECRLSACGSGSRLHQCGYSTTAAAGNNESIISKPKTESGSGVKLESLFVDNNESVDDNHGETAAITTAMTMMRRPKRVAEASLTLLRVAANGERGGNVSTLSLNPMEIKSWQLKFH